MNAANKQEIIEAPAAGIPSVPVSTTPAALLAIAVQQGADLQKLEKLMELQERWERNEARKLFNESFSAFKAEAIAIVKRTMIKDGPLKGKFHANLFDVVDAVTPGLSKHGLAISWSLTKDDPQWMEVTCTLRHVAGYSESVSMGAAPDTGPGRNAIQARGSSKSYLERYTATAILGLAAQDADDDGSGAEPLEVITESQALDLLSLSQEVAADVPKFLEYLSKQGKVSITSIEQIPAKMHAEAVKLLERKRK